MFANNKDILIIYPQLEKAYSGGQVIDFAFIQELKTSDKLSCEYLLDSMIPDTSILGYIFFTLLNIRKIACHRLIFTNSRLYTRLLPCFLFLKLFYRDIRIIAYHHHFNYYTQKGVLRYVHKLFELFFLKIIDVVIIPSPYVRDEMTKILPNVNMRYIEIGFDLQPYFDQNKLNLHNLLFVGTVEQRKGIHHLVYLARFLLYQDIKFHIDIVGNLSDIDYVKSIKDNINNNSLNDYITLWGRVETNELEKLYKDADVFVFPSSHEGYGMVIVEAFSYGLPVIAFDNSAIPYTVVDNYNGLIALDNDSNDFSIKVKEILANEDLWGNLRLNAYDSAQKAISFQHMLAVMRRFIKEL